MLLGLVVGFLDDVAAIDPVILHEGLTIGSVGRAGRTPFQTDAIVHRIVTGTWQRPVEGAMVELPGLEPQAWRPIRSGADDAFTGPTLRGGYVYIPVESPVSRKAILIAVGHNMAYVNGEPRMGDPYGYGTVRLPIELRRGVNDLLFHVGRGRLTVRLDPVERPLSLGDYDFTLPDLIVGERQRLLGAVMLTNATDQATANLAIRATLDGVAEALTPIGPVLPMSVRKVGFDIPPLTTDAPGQVVLRLDLVRMEGSARHLIHSIDTRLAVRSPRENHKRTFRSEIDGSVQYYAVNPSSTPRTVRPNALVLSVHGASVEATGQAAAYGQKTWADIVCPTNRRPYGFDWEEWGRMDALEVLKHATEAYRPDPTRIYLTGHSMGGHGTWHLGVTYPDQFAAIGPSAGWISFFTYAGGERIAGEDALAEMMRRATNPSDTLGRVRNLGPLGVYILHGESDRNVPARESRDMARVLEGFHRDWTYHEEPGADHWWDNSSEPGAACVDWPPMFDLFSRRRLPQSAEVREVEFTTVNPAISSRMRWVEIVQQQQSLAPSTVRLRLDPLSRRFSGTTENVRRLSFSLAALTPGEPVEFFLDDSEVYSPWRSGVQTVHLALTPAGWVLASEPSPLEKGSHRAGPFKEAMRGNMLFVFGTRGTREENAWALRKARYDAEQWWYRGNGSVDVIPDHAFSMRDTVGRTVMLYGNADTNGAWGGLLGSSPVQVRRGMVIAGDHEVREDDLAVLFCRPRPDSAEASVVVISGTGLRGMMATGRLPIFVSGVQIPDVFAYDPTLWTHGAAGARGAGFFGPDWSVESGEFAWR